MLGRSFWTLILALFVNKAGTMVVPFLALFLRSERALTEMEVAFAFGLYGAGGIAGAPLGGWCADRLGRKPTIVGALAGSATAMALLAFPAPLPLLALEAFALGLANMTLRPAATAAIVDLVPEPLRPRAFGFFRVAMNLGFGAGSLAGGLLSRWSFRALFAFDAGTAVLGALGVLLFVAETRPVGRGPEAAPGGGARGPVRTFACFCALAFLVFLVSGQFMSNLPMSLQRRGLPESLWGGLVALNCFFVALAQVPVTLFARRLGLTAAMALGAALYGVGYGLVAFGASLPLAATCVAIFTLGEMFYFPQAAAFAGSLAPPTRRGRWLGFYSMTHGVADVVAPSVGAFVLTRAGDAALWSAAPLLGGMGATGLLLLGRSFARRVSSPAWPTSSA